MTERLPCQGCGRPLVPLADGTSRHHGRYSKGHGRCDGSGYRLVRWPEGQHLRHHAGDIWIVFADIGGDYGDYWIRCVAGREKGRDLHAHGEYMHRHGWTAVRA